MKKELMNVVFNREIATETFELVLQGSLVKSMMQAGQFLHVKVDRHDLILRRPISIASIDEDTCTLIYRVIGAGTHQLALLHPGDQVDVLGPLGHGFTDDFLKPGDRALIVGGGIGVAPLHELGKRLKAKGVACTFVLGFARHELMYYHEKFLELGTVHITTDDGSYGTRGHVGLVVSTLTEPDVVYACGPTGLNRAIQQHFSHHPQVYLSLEERMGCGIGVCYACDTQRKDKRICKDGPVFRASEVDL